MRGDKNISQSFSTFPTSLSSIQNDVNNNKSNNNKINEVMVNNSYNNNSGRQMGYHQSLSISSGNLLHNNNNNNINNNNNSNGRHITKGLQQSSSTPSVQQQQQKHLSYSTTVNQNSINNNINNSSINNSSNINGSNYSINSNNHQNGNHMMPLFLSNGPSSFPASLRKFRHIKSIIGRNLESSTTSITQSPHPTLYSCYYTLHAPPQQPNYPTYIYPNNSNRQVQDSDFDDLDNNNNNNNNVTNNNNNLEDLENETDIEDIENILSKFSDGEDEIINKGEEEQPPQDNNNNDNTDTDIDNKDEINKYQYQNDDDNNYSDDIDEDYNEDGDDDDLPPPFYTSEVVPNSNNPLWNPFDCYKQLPNDILDTFCSFNICVWDKDNEELPPIFQSDIDLTQLEFIATEVRHFSNLLLPKNTIIFELKDGFYITRETKMQMNSPNLNDIQKIINNEKRKAITGNKTLFLCIVAKKLYNIRLLEQSKSLSKEIEDKLDRENEYLEKLRSLENQRNRIKLLREEAINQQQLLTRDQDKFNQLKRGLVPRSVALTNAGIQFYKSYKRLFKSNEVLKMDAQLLRNLKVSWEKKKWNLITQIRTIYPIGQGNKMLTINGLPLPNSDYNGFDEEQIATALGYVCHILHLASKYLDIPLRYPMTPMGSRSFIKDEISHHSSSKFPLYSKGVEKRIFDYAVFLLNKNLEQLLNSQGLFGNFLLKETLPNIQILLGKSKVSELFNQSYNPITLQQHQNNQQPHHNHHHHNHYQQHQNK